MGYIDAIYYTDEYKGTEAGTELDRYIEQASDVVDQATNYILAKYEFTNLATFIQTQVKKATASQVEFYVLSGGDQNVNAGTSDLSSVSVGGFSYQEGTTATGGTKQSNRISPNAIAYLKPTGMLYTGVGLHG